MNRPESWPRITHTSRSRISPWVTLTAREVEFSSGTVGETYHSVDTFDYVVVLAFPPRVWCRWSGNTDRRLRTSLSSFQRA